MDRRAYRIKCISCLEFVFSLIWWPIETFTLYINTVWYHQEILGFGIILTGVMCCAAIYLYQSVNTKFSANKIRNYFWLSFGCFVLSVSVTNFLVAPMPWLLLQYPKVWFALAFHMIYRGSVAYLLLEQLEEANCKPLIGTEEEERTEEETLERTIGNQSSDTGCIQIAMPN
ncbi:unnamed protein product [Orchesella dallaii]|uniref:XK-related protein n=1 Tax=Orchesella dallaii TaxID=48710 RepID=A0ABP1RZS0_9HEXA